MDVSDLRSISLFDGLSDDQLGELLAAGTPVQIETGVDLFLEGEHADHWWVLVSGSLDLIRHVGREDNVVGKMDVPGRWAGGFRAWDEHGVYLATGRGSLAGQLLRVPAQALRDRFNQWFPFGVHLVAGLFGTARSIESTVRQRESLVTLGTLAAGLAHEINNPAAAASRAVDALEGASQTMLAALGRLTQARLTAEQFVDLDRLRTSIVAGPVLDPLTLADQEETISDWLDDHGVDRSWILGPALAAAGVDLEWCERASAALPEQGLEPALEWVTSTLSVASLLGEVRESTRRISELVAAVRSYSQVDRSSLQNIDVIDGLESTLVMLGHKLRGGITVVRDFGAEVPHIDAHPGELNQVWTNVIDNAVDAMDGVGSLRVSTRVAGGSVVIEIGDTGPGLSSEVAARAFEAFYTTKDVGKGTGLGLDIARRIVVERHGGTIDFDTRDGETVVRVCLPIRAA
ncbi:MAG: ATP-binding protein [Propionibacteriaceae bacterium]